MKKILLIAAAMLICLAANAQFGISVGVLQANNVETASAVGGTNNTISNSGFYAGIFMERPIRGNTFYEVALDYSYLSGKLGDMKTTYHAVNVPFHVKYKIALNQSAERSVRLFGFLGPLFSVGIAADEDHSGNPYLTKTKVSMYDEVLNRFDLKIGAGLGVEFFDHFSLRAGYDFGVLDISASQGTKTRMNYLYVGIEYKF